MNYQQFLPSLQALASSSLEQTRLALSSASVSIAEAFAFVLIELQTV